MRACSKAPIDVKAKIIKKDDVRQSKQTKRKAETVSEILESCAQAAAEDSTLVAGKVFSPQKKQIDEACQFKQTEIKPAQVIINNLSDPVPQYSQ